MTKTKSRGLLVYWKNGDHANIYSLEEDLSGYNHRFYGLQGQIDGNQIFLMGGIQKSRSKTWYGKTLRHGAYRTDNDKRYIFLSEKASSPKEPLFR